jgi:hypothetical protein
MIRGQRECKGLLQEQLIVGSLSSMTKTGPILVMNMIGDEVGGYDYATSTDTFYGHT